MSALTFLLSTAISVAACHAQGAAASNALRPDEARRVEVLIRQRTKITPDDALTVGARMPSDVPGFDQITVVLGAGTDRSKPITFLLSKDGNTLAQFNKFDISKDPRTLVSGVGRPARGGPESAPVEIVLFDDLECPFCARMHAQLFPALTDRYGSSVHVAYRDYPIPQHPWAMRAAVDTNCVASESTPGYWNLVDYIHLHATDFGGSEKSLAKANESLDQLAIDEAKKEGVKVEPVEACIKKQDQTEIKASMKMGESLDVDSTPVLFINGEKFEGAYPLTDVFRMVDQALVAAGKAPPPPYVAPAAPVVGAGKSGN